MQALEALTVHPKVTAKQIFSSQNKEASPPYSENLVSLEIILSGLS